jgi:hypothetical protein
MALKHFHIKKRHLDLGQTAHIPTLRYISDQLPKRGTTELLTRDRTSIRGAMESSFHRAECIATIATFLVAIVAPLLAANHAISANSATLVAAGDEAAAPAFFDVTRRITSITSERAGAVVTLLGTHTRAISTNTVRRSLEASNKKPPRL